MARKVLAWLAVLGLAAPAGAQEVLGGGRGEVDTQRLPEDIPDNMADFRQTPHTDDIPVMEEGADEEAGVGGSGMAGLDEVRQGELQGKVVNVQGNQLWLRHGGAVFPLELTQDTRFTPDKRQALQPGQEVRASFILKGDDYVVKALEPAEPVPAPKPPTEQ
ncbi:hypothetical protein [Archangium lansingense]|uniref:Copper binding protein CusF n=1 Tax=Archangium lansingense TaxID=2995310 RepID=A0ABT4APN1_9BACT|nr:hypothetical protein [Archangium lansinium]MCY1083635.1 hypothetical protein [Archangium lansinium]